MATVPRVSGAELEVLKALWSLGSATIRELTERLYPAGDVAHYATVQKLLERLEDKRCVRRRTGGKAHVYSAAVDRSGLIAGRLRETAEALCEGSLTPLLTHLVGSADLTAEELAELRELVERREPRRGRRRGTP
ncbi:MAG TPA: BlaI/MecI/CopY family transcriptional regulator [Candidatus Polarisedimenticolaceae bacterium]|nr:BlaI/MecI/CopY family transcriptional regulator [Candidatus Polarisedimenticolaceae bacterium]